MPSPEERAASIITENRFLSLATIDASGPWIAPINFVVGPGSHLYFYSATESRHSRALATHEGVAVAIFDSRATSDEVDGMQFSGICSEVTGDDLDAVHAHYFAVNFSDPEEREWWLRPSEEFTGNGLWRFYRLSLQEVFVIDFDSIEQERVDKRISVDATEMWRLVGAQVS
jgi:uncharacterized protein YhbP (UPF0306 family)